MKYILSMKKGLIALFSVFIISVVYAGAFLEYFQGRSEGDNIRLEWKTGDEVNLQIFTSGCNLKNELT